MVTVILTEVKVDQTDCQPGRCLKGKIKETKIMTRRNPTILVTSTEMTEEEANPESENTEVGLESRNTEVEVGLESRSTEVEADPETEDTEVEAMIEVGETEVDPETEDDHTLSCT